jgi:hypothetical protein
MTQFVSAAILLAVYEHFGRPTPTLHHARWRRAAAVEPVDVQAQSE